MKYNSCMKCSSTNIEEITCDGYFTFEDNDYPLKTKYLKCSDCSHEYIGQNQIKENQEYIRSISINSATITIH